MLHHTLVMTLPIRVQHALLHTCWRGVPTRIQAGISTNTSRNQKAGGLHNFLIVLSSGRITYLYMSLDDTYCWKPRGLCMYQDECWCIWCRNKAQADSDDIGEDLGKASTGCTDSSHTTGTLEIWFSWEAHYYLRCFTWMCRPSSFRGFHKSLVQFLQTNSQERVWMATLKGMESLAIGK